MDELLNINDIIDLVRDNPRIARQMSGMFGDISDWSILWTSESDLIMLYDYAQSLIVNASRLNGNDDSLDDCYIGGQPDETIKRKRSSKIVSSMFKAKKSNPFNLDTFDKLSKLQQAIIINGNNEFAPSEQTLKDELKLNRLENLRMARRSRITGKYK